MRTGHQTSVYLPSLNGVRAIGAFIVLISHIEQIKSEFGLYTFYWSPIPGRIGVVLFFVLSGFLISYLLISEREHFKTVHIRHFYIRRILRIWPLYYLIVLLSLFVFNRIDFLEIPVKSDDVYRNFSEKIFLYVCMLPNMVMIPYAAQAWSVGIEEQFYLIYPLLLKFIKRTFLLLTLLVLVIFSPEVLSGLMALESIHSNTRLLIILNLLNNFSISFSCIAIGCAGAWLLKSRYTTILNLIYRKEAQIVSALVLAVLFFFTNENEVIGDVRVYATLFCVLIINMALNPQSVFNLENRVMNFLGRISYGMYMYHPVMIVIALQMQRQLLGGDFQHWPANLLLYVSSILFTILVSALSYNYIEKPFLQIKNRFSLIKSEAITTSMPATV